MQEAEPLQQVRRTYVRYRGQILSYFGGCDYFRLASHPTIQAALKSGLTKYGLNVAASRITTGNHAIYGKLEHELQKFFGAESALLTNSGYVTNLIVAQGLAGQFSHALIDERAHVALHDAASLLRCPVKRFKHRNVADFGSVLKRCGRSARPVVLTDGMFAHNGSVAPLKEIDRLLPAQGLIVIDDAHGAGTLGSKGGGAIELSGITRDRIVQNITLSKAFGVYGGAILCRRELRDQLLQTRMFVGSTPLPPPLANAALAAVNWHAKNSTTRKRLTGNSERIKMHLRKAGMRLPQLPGPIVPIHFAASNQTMELRNALLRAKILPPFITYPGSPTGGYFRFVISSEHSLSQLDNLFQCLAPFASVAIT